MSEGADDTTDAVAEARKMLLFMQLTGNEGGVAYDTIRNLLAHIERIEAENAALKKAIAAVREAREDETFSCGCGRANCGREGVYLQAIDAALALAQTDERKAETE